MSGTPPFSMPGQTWIGDDCVWRQSPWLFFNDHGTPRAFGVRRVWHASEEAALAHEETTLAAVRANMAAIGAGELTRAEWSALLAAQSEKR